MLLHIFCHFFHGTWRFLEKDYKKRGQQNDHGNLRVFFQWPQEIKKVIYQHHPLRIPNKKAGNFLGKKPWHLGFWLSLTGWNSSRSQPLVSKTDRGGWDRRGICQGLGGLWSDGGGVGWNRHMRTWLFVLYFNEPNEPEFMQREGLRHFLFVDLRGTGMREELILLETNNNSHRKMGRLFSGA